VLRTTWFECSGPEASEQLVSPVYIATATDQVTTYTDDMAGREVIRLVEVDGSWLIQEFRWTADAAS